MFRSSLGPVDPIGRIIECAKLGASEGLDDATLRKRVDEVLNETTVYLRPETAQAMFVQFMNVQQSMSLEATLRHRADGQELPQRGHR